MEAAYVVTMLYYPHAVWARARVNELPHFDGVFFNLIGPGRAVPESQKTGQKKKKKNHKITHCISLFSFQAAGDTREENLFINLNSGPLGPEQLVFC